MRSAIASNSLASSPVSSRRFATFGSTRAPRSPRPRSATAVRNDRIGPVSQRASHQLSAPTTSTTIASRGARSGAVRTLAAGGGGWIDGPAATTTTDVPFSVTAGRATTKCSPRRLVTVSPTSRASRAACRTSRGGSTPSGVRPSTPTTNTDGRRRPRPGPRGSAGCGAPPAATRAATPSRCRSRRSRALASHSCNSGVDRVQYGESTICAAMITAVTSQNHRNRRQNSDLTVTPPSRPRAGTGSRRRGPS